MTIDPESDGTDVDSSIDEEVANPAVLTPRRVAFSVKTTVDIIDYHLMLGHLNPRLLKSARKSGILLQP